MNIRTCSMHVRTHFDMRTHAQFWLIPISLGEVVVRWFSDMVTHKIIMIFLANSEGNE